jgi:hypothetical protein
MLEVRMGQVPSGSIRHIISIITIIIIIIIIIIKIAVKIIISSLLGWIPGSL